jgi:hypothetical protein
LKVFAVLTAIIVQCAITNISFSQKFPLGEDFIAVEPSGEVMMPWWISFIGFVLPQKTQT